MDLMSDETKELLEKHVGIHGTAILACMSVMLIKNGYDAEPIGVETKNIWEAGLRIKKDGNKGDVNHADYFLHNTLIEIFCVDRDDDPLIFDEKHEEEGMMYTVNKIGSVLEGRYTLVSGMLEGKNIEEIYKENPGMFERIRQKEVNAEEYDGATF